MLFRNDKKEMNILNHTFLDLVGTGWYYEPLPIPPMPLWEESTKEDSLQFKSDSIEFEARLYNREIDTSDLKNSLPYESKFLQTLDDEK